MENRFDIWIIKKFHTVEINFNQFFFQNDDTKIIFTQSFRDGCKWETDYMSGFRIKTCEHEPNTDSFIDKQFNNHHLVGGYGYEVSSNYYPAIILPKWISH